jgi:glutathione S-transferase
LFSRAHLNDLENILPFFIIAFIFLFTNPGVATAKLVFQLFTGSRIIHTIVYAVMPMPQPSRALAWAVGMVINIYMAVKVLIHFM